MNGLLTVDALATFVKSESARGIEATLMCATVSAADAHTDMPSAYPDNCCCALRECRVDDSIGHILTLLYVVCHTRAYQT